ncbi:substrate-binding domain-containing protein [bacterium]|nr:substrate-binding domain-containing protein [bacterium]
MSWRERDGYLSAMELLSLKEPPTAIFITIGEHIRGVCEAVREKGLRVPEDLELLSFDKLPEDWLFGFPLFSLNTSLYKLGLLAARRLLWTIDGRRVSSSEKRLFVGKVIQIGRSKGGDVI